MPTQEDINAYFECVEMYLAKDCENPLINKNTAVQSTRT